MCAIESFVSKHDYAGRVIGGVYRFESFLGQGGFGEVWRGTSLRDGSAVAIKLLPAGVAKNPKTLTMLRHECDMLKSLTHPNICQILDFIHDESTGSALVTELVQGTDVYQASGGVDCAPLMIQLLQALSYLHGKGVYHFDIKPGNVLVEDGVVKLIDFGLSSFKALEKVAGTPSYMAPEIFIQDTANMKGWTDLYAVGVLWYYCLTRINPFRAPTLESAKEKHFDEKQPDKPDSIFGDIIMKLMARDYDKRYHSADDALKQMQVILGQKIKLTNETAQSYAGASGDFIGREDWMRASLEASPHQFVAVVGGSGMGKTRLLRELKFRAQQEGFRVVAIGNASQVTSETISPLAEAMSAPGMPAVVLLDDFDQWQTEAQAQPLIRMLKIIETHPHVPSSIMCIVSVSNPKILSKNFEIKPIHPFLRDEVGRFLDAIVKVPHHARETLIDQLMQHSSGNPGVLTRILSAITRRGHLVSATGQWDETLFEDITIEVPENSISQASPNEFSAEEVLESCRSNRLSGRSLQAFEKIVEWCSHSNSKLPAALLVEAAECALACGRTQDALQLIDHSAVADDALPLFWKGILLTALRQFPDARTALKVAQEIAQESGDDVLRIRISNQLARCDQLEGNIDAAIAAYRASDAQACTLSGDQQKNILNNELGYALLMKGSHKEALPILEAHAQRCEDAGNLRRYLNTIIQVGDCFMKMDDVQNATAMYSKAIGKARSSQQIDILSHAYNQLSKLQFENNLLNEALTTMKRAIAINYTMGDLSSAAINTNNLGLCQLRAGMNDDAKNNLEVAKVFLERCPDAVQRSLVPCLIGLAELARQGHEPKISKDCLSRATNLAKQHHIYADYKDAIQMTLAEIEDMS